MAIKFLANTCVETLLGILFVNDVLLIQIGICDMVLGIEWLKQLCEVF